MTLERRDAASPYVVKCLRRPWMMVESYCNTLSIRWLRVRVPSSSLM